MNTIRHLFLGIFIVLTTHFLAAQERIYLSGIIRDVETSQVLGNVNISVVGLNVGTMSDSSGYFKLELTSNIQYQIDLSHISCHSQSLPIRLKSDTLVYIDLQKRNVEIKEISVLFSSHKPTLHSEPGREELRQREILRLPSLLGSPDILRSVISLPGVSKGNEGDGGIYVRGGESSQNTMMMDDIEIVNPTHVLGMYSVFNPFTTQSVSVYKSVSPIYYDRKLSSVIAVRTINSDTNRVNGTVNMGNILSDLALNGTSKGGRLSYVIGVRKSYLEIYSKLGSLFVNKKTGDYLKNNMLGFYDINGKITLNSSKKSQQSLSWYLGRDYIYLDSQKVIPKTAIYWQNRGLSLTSLHQLGSSNSLKTVVSYTDYQFSFKGEVIDKKMRFQTDYSHIKLKSYYQHSTDRVTWIGGFGTTFCHLFPKNSTITSNLQENSNEDEFKALENTLFGSYEYIPSNRWMINLGIKLKNFKFIGPYVYVGQNDTTTVSFGNNEVVKTLIMTDISMSTAHALNSNMIWKSSYAFDSQNIHQGIVASIALPADLYVTSSRLIKPEFSHSFSSGLAISSLFNEEFALNIDAYYKRIQNLLIFKLNYNLANTSPNIEDQFYSGVGWSSGIEVSLIKKVGSLTGNISASVSKSRRKFDEFNKGKWFDSKYDRIGDISTTLNYNFNKKYSINVNWVFTGGMKTTLSPGRYWMMGFVMNDFEGINNVRLPAYHRLDVGLNVQLNSKIDNKSVLNFSVINMYNRKNPFFVNYGVEAPEDNPYALRIFAKQVSLIPVMPSISWKYSF